ncbi:MAG: ribbon-helix-helix protein, CopG family [Chloroflexota bacterium]
MYTERTQVLLSPEQVQRVKRLARQTQRSVGAVIRDAIDAYASVPADERRAAVERLIQLDAPVDDWEVMKSQILAGSSGSRAPSQSSRGDP